jgi:hypothetical protein
MNEAAALAAAQIRAQHNLKTPDAIVVGSAQCMGKGTYLLANDRTWTRVAQIPVCSLDTVLNPKSA